PATSLRGERDGGALGGTLLLARALRF
ncbi:MAG: hypothetical protein JWR69_639, partial [Pedosphaera sp.]|nr:hypothetical protein [Pedosphaera sp.]